MSKAVRGKVFVQEIDILPKCKKRNNMSLQKERQAQNKKCQNKFWRACC